MKQLTGAEIRKSFIEYFEKQGPYLRPIRLPWFRAVMLRYCSQTPVWCSFKDVFLGTDGASVPSGCQFTEMHARGRETQRPR